LVLSFVKGIREKKNSKMGWSMGRTVKQGINGQGA